MEFDQSRDSDFFDSADIKPLLELLRRNLWLLLLGLLLSGGAAYAFSYYQTPIYEAGTQVMVTRSSSEGPVSDLTQALNSQQISQTYVELLSQQWVRDAVAGRVGGEIDEKQVQISAATNTQILNLTVEDPDPARAASIADTLVDVLIEQNESIQAARYTEAEAGLDQQIGQVESQIGEAQAALDQANAAALVAQLARLTENMSATQAQIDVLEAEIVALESLETPDVEALQSRKEQLVDRQVLLSGYERAYTTLLINEKVAEATPEITRLEKNLALYQQIYLNLLSNRETVRLERMQNMPNVVQLNPAIASAEPVRPRTLLNTILGALAGLVLAVALVFLRDMLDTTLKTPEQIERTMGLPVLGFVAEMQLPGKSPEQIYVARQPRSPVSEAFRALRTNLEFASVQKPIRTLLVTSPGPTEGKTTVAVNLAAILSQGERRVALVDADMRRPRVHRLIGLPNRTGLSDLFRTETKPFSIMRGKDDLPHLMVVTSGSLPPNPAELLGSHRMDRILEDLKSTVDMIVIDTPPSLVADAQVLATKVDAVLFVIRPGVTQAESARASLEMFKRAGVRLVGVVMNRIPRSRNHYYGGYKYYSPYSDSKGYYAENDALPEKAALEKPIQAQPSLLSRIGGNPPPVRTLPSNTDKIPSPDPSQD
jgi:non-specific protein-tyrosine kinase